MSYLGLFEGAAPATPANGEGTEYLSTAGEKHIVNDSGVDANLTQKARANLLANGGFWFLQRLTNGAQITIPGAGARSFGMDRWFVSKEFALTETVSLVDTAGAPETGLTQGRFYATWNNSANVQKRMLGQILEGTDTALLRGRTVRFQIYLKASANINYRIGLAQLTSAGVTDTVPSGANLFITAFNGASVDPTLGANLSYIAPKAAVAPDNGTINGNGVDIAVTAAWQRFGAVFDVPSTAKNLMVLIWSNAQVPNTSSISTAQALLVDGPEVQDWFVRSISVELMRCQRYFAKTFPIGTSPVQNAGVATGCLRCILGKAAAIALAAQFQWRFPVTMRTTPATITTFNPAAANAQVRQISGTAADLTATATANATDSSVDITATGAATGAIGDQCGVHVSVDAEI